MNPSDKPPFFNQPLFSQPLLAGLIAGLVATVPMTVVMQKLHQWPYPERDALPPYQITKRIAARIGIKSHLKRSNLDTLTLVNHFGFGAGMGGLYSLLTARMAAPPILKGAVWGMSVWALSYLGWLPATDILPPATEHSKRSNGIMILAHLVWGILTALLAQQMTSKEPELEKESE